MPQKGWRRKRPAILQDVWTDFQLLCENSILKFDKRPDVATLCPSRFERNRSWQGSSAVEQGTHKPLVGSSILPLATIFLFRWRGPADDVFIGHVAISLFRQPGQWPAFSRT